MKGTYLLLIVNIGTCCGKGAPPKFGGLYRLLHTIMYTEFHGFNSRINASGLSNFGFWYLLNFLEMVWAPLKYELSSLKIGI